MPLSPPASRRPYHRREVDCRGFLREDGLWDIEARLRDTKSYAFSNRDRGRVEAGEALHDLWLRLTVDDDLRIVAAEAATDGAPFTLCPGAAGAYADLAGLFIRPGFTRAARQRVGNVQGCTHLTELLNTVATVAFQTVVASREQAVREGLKPDDPQRDLRGQPPPLNSCLALADNGDVVRRVWPEHYRGDGG